MAGDSKGQAPSMPPTAALEAFFHIANGISEGIVALDGNGNIASMNDAAARILDMPTDQKSGAPFPLESLTGESISTHFYRKSDNKRVRVAVFREPACEALPEHTLVRIHNITESEQRNEVIRESEMLYRSLTAKSEEGMFIVQDEVIVYANDVLAELLGYATGEAMHGTNFANVIMPKDFPKAKENHRKRINGEPVESKYELTLKHRSGHAVPTDLNVTLYNYKGRLSSLGTVRDLSDRKRADQTIRWKEALLESIVHDIPLALYIVDLRTNQILYTNRKFIDLWNVGHLEESIHKHQIDDDGLFQHMQSAVVDVQRFTEKRRLFSNESITAVIEDMIELVDGRSVRCVSSLIRDQHLNNIGRMYIYEDITSRIKSEKELWNAKEKAELSEQLKDAFIGNMSHEIRTPLNIIIGYTELLNSELETNTNPEQRRVFESIATAGARLIRTIEHIMNISTIESGVFPLHKVYVDMTDLVQTVGNRYAGKAAAKKLSFHVNVPENPVHTYADKYCLEQALENIVENAVKFTEQGTITTVLQPDGEHITIKVHDTGIGIAAEYLPKMFQTFSQEIHGMHRPYEGLGLGMRLTKYYVETNDGTLHIWSNKGTGSTVTLTFPVSTPESAELPPSPNASTTDDRAAILIVEDDETTQKFLRMVLGKQYDIQIAASAIQAMLVLRERRIDAILMDISLHGDVDGVELTRRLKRSQPYAHIPIVATTAHSNAHTRQQCLEAGCDEFLTKPLDIDSLREIVQRLVFKTSS